MQITIKNLIGIKSAEINASPLALISGSNGAGKSSIAAAIRIAMLGEMERVKLKKDIGELAHNGEKDYGAKVVIGESISSFGKAFGNKSAPAIKYADIATGAIKPAEMGDDAMRSMVFDLSGISLTTDEIKKRLSNYDQGKVAILIPEIKKSWAAAEAEAKANVSGEKAVWKSITGETYGEVKAETWVAQKPETNPERLAEIEEEIDMLHVQISQLVTTETEAKTKNSELESRQRNLASHRANAAKVDEFKELLEAAEKALSEHKADIERMEELASGTPEPIKYQCPCCNEALMFNQNTLHKWTHEGKAPDLEAKSSLKRLIDSLDVRVGQVTRRKKELEQALSAKTVADEIEREIADRNLIDVSAISEQLAEKRNAAKAMVAEHNELRKAAEQASQADENTAKAAKHHADAKEWDALQKEMSSSGLRQKILATALGIFNESLARFKSNGIPEVRITNDMMATLAGRSYYLLSESEQWRVNAIMQMAVSMLSGVKIAVIDRLDVLSVTDRPAFLKLFAELAKSGELDHILIAGTLKEPPKLPEPYSVYWLEDGVASMTNLAI